MVRGELPQDAIMQTNIGPFLLSDEQSPINQLSFEVMNTNFRIMKSMINLLNTTEGIQGILCLSPYCLIVSIAKLFDKDRVRQLCELRLVGRILNTEVSIDSIPENLRVKLKDSGSLVFPNGHIEYLQKDYEDEDKEVLKKCAELVGGIYYENS